MKVFFRFVEALPRARDVVAVLAAGFLVCGVASPGWAASDVFEEFDYSAGPLGAVAGGRGWDGPWTVHSGEVQVAHEGWDVAARKRTAGPASAGHLRLLGSTSALLSRPLRSPMHGDLPGEWYFSFRYRLAGPNGRLMVLLGQTEKTGGGNQVRVEWNKNRFVLAIRAIGEWTSATVPNDGESKSRAMTDHVGPGMVVVRVVVEQDLKVKASLWQFFEEDRPPLKADEEPPLVAVEGSGMSGVLGWLIVLTHDFPEEFIGDLDAIRMGSTWQEVTEK